MPLRFLHLTTFYPPFSFGGDAMYVHRLAVALADEGHAVDVLHSVDAYRLLHPDPPEARFAPDPRIRVIGLRSRLGRLAPLVAHQTGGPAPDSRRIRRVLAEGGYDVVHYHNVSLLGPRILAYETGSPGAVKVYSAHDHWLICPTHVLWKYGRRPCETPTCLRCVMRARRPPQAWRYGSLLDRASRHVDQFIAPSEFTAKMHAERGFRRPLTILPYFADRVDGEWKDPGPSPHDRPYFLFVGRLEIVKGVRELVEAWRDVPDYDLLVAGSGTQSEALRAIAMENPRVRLLGHLTQAELGRVYVHAIACVVPSLTYETFGLVVIEAFARKTPVIAHDLGVLPETIRETGGGLTYRTREDLGAVIRGIGGSPKLRRELGERGYQAFERQWTRKAHLEMYLRLLRDTAMRKYGKVPWESRA